MKEEWYEILLEHIDNLGVRDFTELVEDGEYPNAARKMLKPTKEMWGWEDFEKMYKIFKDAY